MRLAQLARLMLWMPLSLSAPRTLLGQWARPAPLRTLARRAQLALLVRVDALVEGGERIAYPSFELGADRLRLDFDVASGAASQGEGTALDAAPIGLGVDALVEGGKRIAYPSFELGADPSS